MIDAIARRHVTLAVIPLAVIASGFLVAPLVPVGYPAKLWLSVSPYEDGLSPYAMLYAGAAALAVLIALAARGNATPRNATTVIALLTIVATTAPTAVLVDLEARDGDWLRCALFALPIAATIVLVIGALRRRGWPRLLGLLGAVAVAALPYGCPIVPGIFNLFSGGLVFVLADLTVLALFVLGERRGRAAR